MTSLRQFFVKKIYADHNDSRAVRRALEFVLGKLGPDDIGLNIGAGQTRLSPRVHNMEIEPADGIDIVGSAESIPVADGAYSIVITQEVLEHIRNPAAAMAEIYRILAPGGMAYVQLPFVIGYHPCPYDYWRFTKEGIVELAEASGFEVVEIGVSVGPATGFYRIAVEFFAILFSVPWSRLYIPSKALFSLLLFPIKLLDQPMSLSTNSHRIEGGYFVILRK